MRVLTLLLSIIIGLIGISFAVLNAETVTFNYLLGRWTMPLSLLIMLMMGLGLLLGLLAGGLSRLRLKRENRRLRAQVRVLEKGAAVIND